MRGEIIQHHVRCDMNVTNFDMLRKTQSNFLPFLDFYTHHNFWAKSRVSKMTQNVHSPFISPLSWKKYLTFLAHDK